MEPMAGVRLSSGRNLGPDEVFCHSSPLGRVTATVFSAPMLACGMQGNERKELPVLTLLLLLRDGSCWGCTTQNNSEKTKSSAITLTDLKMSRDLVNARQQVEFNPPSPCWSTVGLHGAGCTTRHIPSSLTSLRSISKRRKRCPLLCHFSLLPAVIWYSPFTRSVINEEQVQDDKNVYLPSPPFFFLSVDLLQMC